MNTYNPNDLLLRGMEKLGPSGNIHTLHVLRLLPRMQEFFTEGVLRVAQAAS
jgi:hypothetical protein